MGLEAVLPGPQNALYVFYVLHGLDGSPGPKASLVPGSLGIGAAAPGKLPGKLLSFRRHLCKFVMSFLLLDRRTLDRKKNSACC